MVAGAGTLAYMFTRAADVVPSKNVGT